MARTISRAELRFTADRAKSVALSAVEYFAAFDRATQALSQRSEGTIAQLPSWVLTQRLITVGVSPTGPTLVRVLPIGPLAPDAWRSRVIMSKEDWLSTQQPYPPFVKLEIHPPPRGMGVIANDDITITPVEHEHVQPSIVIPGRWVYGDVAAVADYLSLGKASAHAEELWTSAQRTDQRPASFVGIVDAVLMGFYRMLESDLFDERPLHRYLAEHAGILLPPHRRMWSEHRLYRGEQYLVADLILEREGLTPGWLIELESAKHKVFLQNGDLSREARHATRQVLEWAMFIQEDPTRNASGEMEFLRGTPQRLVIMGRGLDQIELMRRQRYADTLVWTYDFLLREASLRWHDQINTQRRAVGLEPLAAPPRLIADADAAGSGS